MLFAVPSFSDVRQAFAAAIPRTCCAGARVEVAPYKRDPGDFVLWKPSTADLAGLGQPWGRGRPGWHIECSAMAAAHLGETIDIHGGGVDLHVPAPRERDRAERLRATAARPSRAIWLHNGFVNFDGEKMSKSLGNIRLVARPAAASIAAETHAPGAADGALPPAARLDGRSSSARRKQKLDRMYGALRDAGIEWRVDAPAGRASAVRRAGGARGRHQHARGRRRAVQRGRRRRTAPRTGSEERPALAESLRAGAWLLGLLTQDPSAWFGAGAGSQGDDAEIDSLVKQRDAFKRQRNFKEADLIRDRLAAQGIVIEDAPQGARWSRGR